MTELFVAMKSLIVGTIAMVFGRKSGMVKMTEKVSFLKAAMAGIA